MAKKIKEELLGGSEDVLIVKQETVEVDGEIKIKYTLADGSEKFIGL